MYKCQGTVHIRVRYVGIEMLELRSHEHTLVIEGTRRERTNVKVVGGEIKLLCPMLYHFAGHVRFSLECIAFQAF